MLLYIFVFLLGLYNNQVVETIKSKFKTLKNDTLSETILNQILIFIKKLQIKMMKIMKNLKF